MGGPAPKAEDPPAQAPREKEKQREPEPSPAQARAGEARNSESVPLREGVARAPQSALPPSAEHERLLRMQQTYGNAAGVRHREALRKQPAEATVSAVQREDSGSKSGQSDDRPVDLEIFYGDGKHQPTDVGFARKVGTADAKNIRAAGSLSRDIKLDVAAKRKYFQPPARAAYVRAVYPALAEVTREEIDMSEDAAATRQRDAIIAKGRMGMYTDISNLFQLIENLKEKRLEAWKKNEDVAMAKPSMGALEVAIAIVSEGFGGIALELIEHSLRGHAAAEIEHLLVVDAASEIKHGVESHAAKRDDRELQLGKEFLGLAGLEATDLASEYAFHKALDEAKDTLGQAAKKALELEGEASVRNALVSNPSNGMLECYVEAVKLQAIAEQKEEGQQFTTKAAKFSDGELANQWVVYNAIYKKLMESPDAFMRELTVGFIRLMDEMRLEKRDEKFGGDITKQRQDDALTSYNDFRRGNLVISFGWPNGQEDLGDWSHPNLKLEAGAETAGIDSEMARYIAGARIKDLPLSMTLSFWAVDKSLPWYDQRVKVEFDRDAEGNIYLKREGLDWLAKYNLGENRVLTEREQKLNAWYGARKLYREVRNRLIRSGRGLSYL